MKNTIRTKLESVSDRFEEIAGLLADPEIINNNNKFRELSKEYSKIEPTVNLFKEYQIVSTEILAATEMVSDIDNEISKLGQEELKILLNKQESILLKLQKSLLPADPYDESNVYLEIRAGTGGDEAAIFVGDLFRMYTRYAENTGWSIEVLSSRESDQGGYKEIISRISGNNIYAKLKFESGAHRVQRIPTTESQGRIHTSACTVAILPEPHEVEEVDINSSDLRVDTYKASGSGGQHVNKTDSAVRLTHLPSGIVVECQDERSQHKNRARAMSLLQARLLDKKTTEQEEKHAAKRKLLVGTGDRSERIRTYNFPQGRVTDHRINLTLYKLNEIIEGGLHQIIEPLNSEHQASQLAELDKD